MRCARSALSTGHIRTPSCGVAEYKGGVMCAHPYCVKTRFTSMNQLPLNPEPDGVCRTIKASYHKTSFANFIRRGTVQQELRCIVTGWIWRSRQNGMVYDPEGVAPTLMVGHHSGVEPKIIEYEKVRTQQDT